ncbi:MAG: hypothetical protein AAGF07_04430 [Patescibacteria group bacterium]
MDLSYCYKLGHQPEIGQQEFQYLTGVKDIILDSGFILSNSYIDAQKTGSLVYTSKVIRTWKVNINKISSSEVCKLISHELLKDNHSQEIPKKIGVILPSSWKSKALSNLKTEGVKKINFLATSTNLNYGHWKQTKNWFLLLQLKKVVVLVKILNHSDQEFWQYLDSSLPAGEMSRGMINLKLARSLLNLSTFDTVWDPFCGYGRIGVAGLDIIKRFIYSDIQADLLSTAVKQNYEFAEVSWSKYGFKQRLQESKKLAKLQAIFELDIKGLDKQKMIKHQELAQLSIVTEGYLGKNFNHLPTYQEIKNEWVQLKNLWQEVITKADRLMIPEIIFCLPYYNLKNQQLLPDFIDNLIVNTNYHLSKFNGRRCLLYSRKSSYTGHCIIRLSTNI